MNLTRKILESIHLKEKLRPDINPDVGMKPMNYEDVEKEFKSSGWTIVSDDVGSIPPDTNKNMVFETWAAGNDLGSYAVIVVDEPETDLIDPTSRVEFVDFFPSDKTEKAVKVNTLYELKGQLENVKKSGPYAQYEPPFTSVKNTPIDKKEFGPFDDATDAFHHGDNWFLNEVMGSDAYENADDTDEFYHVVIDANGVRVERDWKASPGLDMNIGGIPIFNTSMFSGAGVKPKKKADDEGWVPPFTAIGTLLTYDGDEHNTTIGEFDAVPSAIYRAKKWAQVTKEMEDWDSVSWYIVDSKHQKVTDEYLWSLEPGNQQPDDDDYDTCAKCGDYGSDVTINDEGLCPECQAEKDLSDDDVEEA